MNHYLGHACYKDLQPAGDSDHDAMLFFQYGCAHENSANASLNYNNKTSYDKMHYLILCYGDRSLADVPQGEIFLSCFDYALQDFPHEGVEELSLPTSEAVSKGKTVM